jgi:hypothetical protein
MASRRRSVRPDASDPGRQRPRTSRQRGQRVSHRVAAAEHLDLGARIRLAADLQGTAGNAAVATLVGLVRTNRRKEPPGGVREIMETGSGATRGLTRTRYTANPPIFRSGGVSQVEGGWAVRPAPVRLPSLDHEVFYPAPGRHRLRAHGQGGHYLEVSEAWSGRLLQGEEEHVGDVDMAWDRTWGCIARAINALATGQPITGATPDAARDAAWQAFKRRLPEALRPRGDAPTTEAQEEKWGVEDRSSFFRRLMRESERARDHSGWHTPDQTLKATEGNDRIDELAVGGSRIGQVAPEQLIRDAWGRLVRG